MGIFDRYETVRKHLKLEKVKSGKKKFIIIQIDALSHEVLQHYLKKGGCNYIRHLMEKEGYHLTRYNCGIPSGTPAAQAGIMYGANNMVPGFRFVDKKAKRQWSFGHPNHVKHFERDHFTKRKGILKDGSSYSNHFTGDAKRSILTMSTIT
ncbi:hypothetical protein KY362_01045, partial [Candidatus Woesearchaeota archaeon]|nr:hypothetical protein [Candidatus Woesearchaeota archaeon]